MAIKTHELAGNTAEARRRGKIADSVITKGLNLANRPIPAWLADDSRFPLNSGE